MFLRNVVLSSWALCHAVVQVSGTRAVSVTSGDKSFPVRKVIDLLKKMQAELTQDAANDQAIMDKMDCWCHTNRKEKTESMVTAQKQIVDLQDAKLRTLHWPRPTRRRSRNEMRRSPRITSLSMKPSRSATRRLLPFPRRSRTPSST